MENIDVVIFEYLIGLGVGIVKLVLCEWSNM